MRGSPMIFCLFLLACSESAGLTGSNKKRPPIQPSNTVMGKSQSKTSPLSGDSSSKTASSSTSVDSSSNIGSSNVNPSDSFGGALGRCSTANLVQISFSLSFPPTEGMCNWDRGKAKGAMMGHYEQKLNLDVSPNWVICKLGVSSNKSDFYYDDKIAMTVNDRLLWGNSGIFDLLSSNRDSQGLIKFNWNQIFGKNSGNDISCMEGSTTCTGPRTEKNGAMGVSLSEATNLKVTQLLLREKRLEFQLIITGDDDPKIDCGHNGLPLNVQISYYEN